MLLKGLLPVYGHKQHFQSSMLYSLIIWDNQTKVITGMDQEPSVSVFINFILLISFIISFLDMNIEQSATIFQDHKHCLQQ